MNADHNTTISLPRLIQELSEAGGIDAATSRKFIHEFFALIEDTLVQGQQVKIKGIGTFLVEDRENGLVGFTPDPDLAAAVNAPFAMFAPVELGDGISAEELDEETDTAENTRANTAELPQQYEMPEPSPDNPATATDDIE
ncbi:MAG: HU family DNA-binding protein, partial [Muribaculaceae bacterium]|nr:HU family DNA-binding protein [Muribaculaceae bacterium]